MTLQTIRDWLADRENRVVVRALAVSLVVWTGASAANAMVDVGAVLHDATCADHAGQGVARKGR